MAGDDDFATCLFGQFLEPFFRGVGKEEFLVISRATVKKPDECVAKAQQFFLLQLQHEGTVFRAEIGSGAGVHDPFFRLGGLFEILAFKQFDDPVIGIAADGKGAMEPQPIQGLVGKGGIDQAVPTVEHMGAVQGGHCPADRFKCGKVAVDITD